MHNTLVGYMERNNPLSPLMTHLSVEKIFSTPLLWAVLLVLLLPTSRAKAQEREQSFTFLNIPTSAQTMAIGGLALTYVDGMDG